ncbi:MAG: CinA family nicotinamide mononucleotide deamidase-related protein [Anaerolineae bacterium]|nr:CinA family nicotinamide mononucleotide deamidase-related protein [Anaerolineae bacterium]
MQAEIVSIGTELLLGEITDTNKVYIAQQLRAIGVDLIYCTTVGDNEARIAEVIDAALDRVDVVITTGGLGPTVDDVTREGIAAATDCPLEFHEWLYEEIGERFKRFRNRMSENNRRQAFAPRGARPISNPVGTAPIFILETDRGVVMTLPGVPKEMTYLMGNELIPYLKSALGSPAVIKIHVLRTAGIGESQIDERIGDLMTLSNPTVGLAAHPGHTDIRIAAKAGNEEEACGMIEPVAGEVRRRLGTFIYGTDDQTLADTVIGLLEQQNLRLAVIEAGTGGCVSEGIRAAEEHGVLESTVLLEAIADLEIDHGLELEKMALELANKAREGKPELIGAAAVQNSDFDPVTGQDAGVAIAIVGEKGRQSRRYDWLVTRNDTAGYVTNYTLSMLWRLLATGD